MSSFGDNFQRDDQKDVQFDTNAFYPVLQTGIIISFFVNIYLLYKSFKNKVKYRNENEYRNCHCSYCKKKLKLLDKNYKKRSPLFYIIILIILVISFVFCYKKIKETQENIKSFNPYNILDISESADIKEIKRAYKKLALKYHPDKNPNNLQAKAMFMLISKAYNSLTDEESKKNYELYGNPDGPTSMRLSIGLPSFVLDKKNHMKILIGFLIIVCVIIPYEFFVWNYNAHQFEQNGILINTVKLFAKMTNEQSNIKLIPLYLGLSPDFHLIKDNNLQKEKEMIEALFDKYLNEYPEDLKKSKDKLNLKNKKSIAIAYAYSFSETDNDLYRNLHHKNEYIITLGKLIDPFFFYQDDKYKTIQMLKRQFPEGTGTHYIPPVTVKFIREIAKYQQCFFQGLPINNFIPNCSYEQLPYINKNNFELIAKSDNIRFRDFLAYNEEEKVKFLKKVFKFDDEKINDILEAAKSIPLYEFKLKKFVDGFEDADFVVGDKCTVNIKITRKNIGKAKLGIGHSKTYPGLFNECIQILVLNNGNLIGEEKIKIDKKVTLFEYSIALNLVGKIPLEFQFLSTCYYGINEKINIEIDVVQKSEKRDKMLREINKRKVKIGLSYFQEIMKEAGMDYGSDGEDEEEEKEEEEDKKEENEQEKKEEEENKEEKKN
jgi:translocation protein SEC63